jgi:hypothetical protein
VNRRCEEFLPGALSRLGNQLRPGSSAAGVYIGGGPGGKRIPPYAIALPYGVRALKEGLTDPERYAAADQVVAQLKQRGDPRRANEQIPQLSRTRSTRAEPYCHRIIGTL